MDAAGRVTEGWTASCGWTWIHLFPGGQGPCAPGAQPADSVVECDW